MYAPVIRKITRSNKVLVERALPEDGKLLVKEKEVIQPFDKLGTCKAVRSEIVLPQDFKPSFKGKIAKTIEGVKIGKSKGKKVVAPFSGSLFVKNNQWVLRGQKSEFTLLSGVWGIVEKILSSRSVLIRSQMKDVLTPIATGGSCEGELVVFPNPSILLLDSFLEKFTKDAYGKIFYVGYNVGLNVLKKAKKLGARGILSGSVTKEAYTYAKKEKFSLGVFEGFGKIDTSSQVFNELKAVSNRFVFFDQEDCRLRIPVPKEFKTTSGTKSVIKVVRKGYWVQIFQVPHFGAIGEVDSVGEGSILVKVSSGKKPVEVSLPNFFIVE